MDGTERKRIDEFIRHLETERRLSQQTCVNYRRDIEALADWCAEGGVTEWDALSSEGIRGWSAACYRRGLSSKSIQRRLSAARSFFRWLMREKPWDFLFFNFAEPHPAGHYLWHVQDPDYPTYPCGASAGLGAAVLEPFGHGVDRIIELVGRYGVVDQADLRRAGCGQQIAGQQIFLGPRVANQLRPNDRATIAGDETDRDMGVANLGRVGGIDDVAEQRQGAA